jgi:hypothetical protein
MSTLQEIEAAVSQLKAEELAAFREWFAEFDARAWDLQFEQDVSTGRLDKLAEEALEDLREGRCDSRQNRPGEPGRVSRKLVDDSW